MILKRMTQNDGYQLLNLRDKLIMDLRRVGDHVIQHELVNMTDDIVRELSQAVGLRLELVI